MFGNPGLDLPIIRPGLTGMQQGEVRATIYRRNRSLLSLMPIPLDGRTHDSGNPCIVQAQVQMMLGGAASFQLGLKVPEGMDLLEEVGDDDWVDIEMGFGGKLWHVLRGMVDQVRCSTSVNAQGAISRNWLVTGQSFQKVWQQTPMWFGSMYGEAASLQAGLGSTSALSQLGIGTSVPTTIASYLYTYANLVAKAGRASVALPTGMPNVGSNFGTTWRLDDTDFSDADAPRQSILPNMFAPNQNVWDVAQGWSDPFFVEMFCAMLPAVQTKLVRREGSTFGAQSVNATSAMGSFAGQPAPLDSGLSVNQSAMTLVVRNKPFICVSKTASRQTGYDSPWFKLPMLQVIPQQVVSIDLGKNGMERVNSFMCASQVMTGSGGGSLQDLAVPLWNVPDMADHGMRIMDVVTQYIPIPTGALTAPVIYRRLRARVRDWYCANALLLSGNVTFGRGFPQLQPGMRLRVLAAADRDQVTGYVESVVHTYAPGRGVQTSAGITRAYQGTDAAHIGLLQRLVQEYTAPFS